MLCHVCRDQATGQCQRCGKFYCPSHGDVLCAPCAEASGAPAPAGSSAPAPPPCYECGAAADRACRCGKFYCPRHGGDSLFLEGPACVACNEARRPFWILGALFWIGVGVLFLAGTRGATDSRVPFAMAMFAVAGIFFWLAFRVFPRPSPPAARGAVPNPREPDDATAR